MVSVLQIVLAIFLFFFAILFGFNAYYFQQAENLEKKASGITAQSYTALIILNWIMAFISFVLIFVVIFAWPRTVTTREGETVVPGTITTVEAAAATVPVGLGAGAIGVADYNAYLQTQARERAALAQLQNNIANQQAQIRTFCSQATALPSIPSAPMGTVISPALNVPNPAYYVGPK